MGSITYNQGESLLLSSFFQNEPPTLGPFYVGLGTGGAFLAENGTLDQIVEVSGQGSERHVINRDSSRPTSPNTTVTAPPTSMTSPSRWATLATG